MAGLLLTAFLALSATARQESSCASCHQDVADAEAGHGHARASVGCTDCHGGDPTQATKEAAKAPETDYRGIPAGEASVKLCGDCHADVRRMNPYGLRTDQLRQYETSHHGEALLRDGDPAAATCADCHGAHGILGPGSSESPVHPRNVPATCARCHADSALADPRGLDAGIPAAFRDSVHGRLLIDHGDLSAPHCATCHGSHGAVPPGFRTVEEVCGQCHVREKELFQESPHAGEFEGCTTCHGSHRIGEADVAIFERLCGLCHDDGTEALQTRDRIAQALAATVAELAATTAEIEAAAQQGLVTPGDRMLLQEASTALARARVEQHALDAAGVAEITDEARDEMLRLSSHLTSERAEERRKRVAVVPVVGFLLLMSFGFWLRRRSLHQPL